MEEYFQEIENCCVGILSEVEQRLSVFNLIIGNELNSVVNSLYIADDKNMVVNAKTFIGCDSKSLIFLRNYILFNDGRLFH